MQDLNIALVVVGGLTLALSLVAGLVRNKVFFLSEPMAAVLLGVVVGPLGLELLSLSAWGDQFVILEQFARLTVGLAVVAAALRLPRRYFRTHPGSMAAVLVPGMVGMWLVGGALAYVFLDVSVLVALLVGAIVTPTDPVLAGTIVTGETAQKHIPAPVRNLLSAESGANDGLAYPLVFLPILFLQHPPRRALADWLAETILWEVGFAVVVGVVVGAVTGWLEQASQNREYLEQTSLLSVTVALTFAVLGGVKLLGSDGLLAAFVAGLLFNRFADASDEGDEQQVQETVLRLFTFPVFVLFGIALPVEGWIALGWAGVALAVGVILLRRLPMLLVFSRLVEPIDDRGDSLFAAWFGPVGIAALFYAMVAHRILANDVVWVATSLVITMSVIVHGVTATPFAKAYARAIGHIQPASDDDERSSVFS